MNPEKTGLSTYRIDTTKDKQTTNEEIVVFIHKYLEDHDVELKDIGFMGTLYGMHHMVVPVPGLIERSFGRLCSKIDDTFINSSPQRLVLVDEYQAGMQKLNDTFLVCEAKLGIIGWYGEDEFQVQLISS